MNATTYRAASLRFNCCSNVGNERTRERRKSGGFLLAEGKRRRLPKIYLGAPSFSSATVARGHRARIYIPEFLVHIERKITNSSRPKLRPHADHVRWRKCNGKSRKSVRKKRKTLVINLRVSDMRQGMSMLNTSAVSFLF